MAQSLADALMQQQQPQPTGNPEGFGPIPLASMPQALGQAPTLADGWDANANAYKDYVAKQQADLVARGLNDPQTGWPTQAGWLDAAHQIGNSLLMGTTAPGIRAFHGSPHDFDAFQLSKIGSGEGAQAYGHGLYFAGDEGVARSYRDQLSGAAPNYAAGQHMTDAMRANVAAQQLRGQALDETIARDGPSDAPAPDIWAKYADQHAALTAAKDTSNAALAEARANGKPGRMYEVNLNANPEHMLDWDKPLSEQHPVVQDAWQKAGLPDNSPKFSAPRQVDGGYVVDYQLPGAQPSTSRVFKTPEDAQRIASSYSAPSAGEELAKTGTTTGSMALHQAGIPGIRYLDGQSRAAGEGTHNYVMFNPAHIEILRKYGLLGTLGGAASSPFGFAAAGQGQQ